LSAVKNESISALLERAVIEPGVAPAATAGYASEVIPPQIGAAGGLPEGPARPDTIFDLASVSKPIVACTLLRLQARGQLDLQQPLGELVPELGGTRSAEAPLELLLSHRSGLEAHRALFAPVFAGQPLKRWAALRAAANGRRPECSGSPPAAGFAPVYSDLGYALLGVAIEAVTRAPLDEIVDREVTAPLRLELGSARLLRARRPSFARDVAPTEVVRARGGLVRGVVHDENAWALSGHGASGHAGLFGTAFDVLRFGAALLAAHAGRSDWLSREALLAMVEPRPGGSLRAGFDGKSSHGSSAGALSGPETFGHLGFTGTSLWCDPRAGIAVALLTNRVHPTRERSAGIRAARPAVHDALFGAAKAVLPAPPDP
jgi:serine-type D-Ala-D-Ala carboxypeptidase